MTEPKKPKRRRVALGGLACALVGAALGAGTLAVVDSGGNDRDAKAVRSVHFLFAQAAQQGRLRALDRERGRYRLSLRNVPPNVAYFTDAPVRLWGALPLHRYTRLWDGDFGSDPPNAAVLVPGADPSRDLAIVELERARYRQRSRQLVYDLRMLPEEDARGQPWTRTIDQRLPSRLDDVNVFVDALTEIAGNVGGQVTDAITHSNVKLVPTAPSMAMGSLYQELSHSVEAALENSGQEQGGLESRPGGRNGVITLYEVER